MNRDTELMDNMIDLFNYQEWGYKNELCNCE